MPNYQYLYGPIPSRRLGKSLGISPTLEKTCNYNCIYCQLGPTKVHIEKPEKIVNIENIIAEFDDFLTKSQPFDVVSIVGNGEPTLEIQLKELILALKKRTKKPIALITNGSLFDVSSVFEAAMHADIVLPTLSGYDDTSFKRMHRPSSKLSFLYLYKHLKTFSEAYKGSLWIEIMFMKGYNDHDVAIAHYQTLLDGLSYDRLYLNTPVRPPSLKEVEAIDHKRMLEISKTLKGIPIDFLSLDTYQSSTTDDLVAVKNLIKYHPMHQYEIATFLQARNADVENLLIQLANENDIETIHYKGYITYRLR